MAKLDSLIVDLKLNTAELRKGLDDANKQLKGFGDKLNDLAGVIVFDKIGRMALEASRRIVTFALSGVEAADKLNKLSQSSGVGVEELSRLGYAALLSGVGTDSLASGLNKLNTNIANAATGQREQVALFGALGVSVKDSAGQTKNASGVFGELAEKFSRMEDGPHKAKLANELFGKQLGAELLPLLNSGKAGLVEFAAEADRLGVTISGPAAAAAEAFNDSLEKIQIALVAVAQRATAQVTPAFEELTQQLLNSRDGTSALKDLSDVLATLLKLLATVATVGVTSFNQIGQSIARAASAGLLLAQGEFRAALEVISTAPGDTASNWRALVDRLGIIWGDATKKAEDTGKKIRGAFSAQGADEEEARRAKAIQEREAALKKLEQTLTDLQTKVSAFDKTSDEVLRERLDKGDLSKELEKVGDKAAEMRDRILEAGKALHNLEVEKLSEQLTAQRMRDNRALNEQISRRGNDYFELTSRNRQLTPEESFAKDTAGFKNFTDALNALAENTKKNAKALDDAQVARANGEKEAADDAMRAAEKHKLVADKAGIAASAFEEAAKRTAAAAEELRRRVSASVQALAGQLASKVGELGGIIQTGMSAWKQGGVWAALAAVVVELLSRFKRFGEIVDFGTAQVASVIDQLAPAFSVLVDALKSVMTLAGVITKATAMSIEPVIKIIARVVDYIAKIITPIAGAFQQIGEVIGPFVDGLLAFGDSLGIMDGAIKMISGIFNLLSVGILFVVNGFLKAWGVVLTGVRDFIKIFGANTAELDKTIAANARAIEKNQQHMDNTMRNLLDPNANAEGAPHGVGTFDTPTFTVPMTELGDAASKAADNLNKFSASLTNVPEGFRYNQRWFEAQAVDNGTGPTGVQGGNGYVPPPVQITINGNLIAEKDLAQFIKNLLARDNFRTSGIGLLNNSR